MYTVYIAYTPPQGTEFAIPNFTNTTNRVVTTGDGGIYEAIATTESNSYMNGTYTTYGSHYFFGNETAYGSYNCFQRNGIPLLSSDNLHYYGPCWESRSASNNYLVDGTYSGNTTTIVDGIEIKGEYISISAPYNIILKSYSLISSNYNGVSSPCSGWVIAGSNDGGNTYTMVDQRVNNPLPLNDYGLFTTNNIVGYSTYIIIITSITYGQGAANIGTWNIYSLPQNIPVSNACFPQKTPITTNQGIIPIEHIDISKHTIRNKKIVAITKTVTQDKYMVCFEKDSLGENIPCDKTIISKNHMIFYKGKMRPADYFTNAKIKNVKKVNYSGEILYNVLLEEHDKMVVNNLICETLHPNNYLAKLYKILKIFETDIGKNACIKEMNRYYHRAKKIPG